MLAKTWQLATLRIIAVLDVRGTLQVIARSPHAERVLDVCADHRNHVGVLFQEGRYVETLAPGLSALWRGAAEAKVVEVDMRELIAECGSLL